MDVVLPYRIAVLCYLFDAQGRVLLLHRRRPPNQDLYSPIGGKLEQTIGESPAACAVREIKEEADIDVSPRDLHLTGIVSETAFDDEFHWLMFMYEVTTAVTLERMTFNEGRLEWHDLQDVENLEIPSTDRHVIWPLFRKYRGKFFTAHINLGNGAFRWRLEQPGQDATGWHRVQ